MSSPSVKPSALLRWLSVAMAIAVLVVRFWPHGGPIQHATAPAGHTEPVAAQAAPSSQSLAPGAHAFGAAVGFRSRERFEEHFRKHGREFGVITPAEYLRLAQALRDRPAGGDVLERVRADGVVTRFDRASGAFLAFGGDGVIRTFFRPNDGERYFERQATRDHGSP